MRFNANPSGKLDQILKSVIKRMPVILTGICCWVILSLFSGTFCWIRSLFGIPCPGCGSTRATFALLHGHIKEALIFHPLILVTFALISAYIFTLIFKINIFDKKKYKRINIFIWCVFALYIGVYITRMILFYPRIEPMTFLDESMLGRMIGFIKYLFDLF